MCTKRARKERSPRDAYVGKSCAGKNPYRRRETVARVTRNVVKQLERPFGDVDRFVRLSSKTFGHDMELDCVVVGIGTPHGRSYKVPVRVRYGRTACHIPEYKYDASVRNAQRTSHQ